MFCNRPERQAIVLTRLVRKSEEAEERKGAEDQAPATQLKRYNIDVALTPYESRELVHMGVVEMSIRPSLPRLERVPGEIKIDCICGHRCRAKEFDGSQGHQAEVSVNGERFRRREELTELSASFHKRV